MPFVKGQSANPGGRPKTRPFYDALNMEIKAAGKDHKKLRKIAKKLLDEAEKGELSAIREVADRLDGKPTQGVDHSGSFTVNIDSKDADCG